MNDMEKHMDAYRAAVATGVSEEQAREMVFRLMDPLRKKGTPMVIKGGVVTGGYEPKGGYIESVISRGGATVTHKSPNFRAHEEMQMNTERRVTVDKPVPVMVPGGVLRNEAVQEHAEGSIRRTLETTASQISETEYLVEELERALRDVVKPEQSSAGGTNSVNPNPGTSSVACAIWNQGEDIYRLNRRLESLLNRVAI